MRSIRKFYTAKKLIARQVLKFDIRDPGPFGRLWRQANASMNMPPENSYSALRKMNMAMAKWREDNASQKEQQKQRKNKHRKPRKKTHMTTRQRNACRNIQTRIQTKREIPSVVKTEKDMHSQNKKI